MENWITFGQGPLFRFSFVLMLLGLFRLFFLSFVSGGKKHRNKSEPKFEIHETPQRLLKRELNRIYGFWKHRFLYSLSSTLFHLGLVAVPFFLAAHVTEWRKGVGFSWWALPQDTANFLTIITLMTAFMLLILKMSQIIKGEKTSIRNLFWIIFLAIPFLTGYIAINININPGTYQMMMAVHIYTGCLTMILLPFTGMAECVLAPIAKFSHAFGALVIHKIAPILSKHLNFGGSR